MTLSHERVRQLLADATHRLASQDVAVGDQVVSMPKVGEVRRRRLTEFDRSHEAGFLTLVQGADGLLDWQVDAGP